MKIFTLVCTIALMSFTFNSTTLHVGEKAPELVLNNPNGEEIKLSSLQGNIVLVDFWASWCKPCRALRPEIVKLNNQFKDAEFKNANGFEIFSVSLDKSQDAWAAAIEQEGMDWDNQGSDLLGWNSKAARTYGVRSIPFNVLLDESGEIIATNLNPVQLKATLEKLQ